MSILNSIKKLKKLSSFDIIKESIEVINLHSEYLETMIRFQLQSGFDGDGKEVTLKRKGGVFPNYAPLTVKLKEEYAFGIGAITNRITNYFTGTFAHSIKFVTNGTTFEAISDVPYFTDIIKQSGSGKRIMELSKPNVEKFKREILIPELQKRYKAFNSGI